MKISNLVSDEDRHHLNNIVRNGTGELPDENGKVSPDAEYKLIVEKGFIVRAEKVIRLAGGNTDATQKG